jgi:hypothetical protein
VLRFLKRVSCTTFEYKGDFVDGIIQNIATHDGKWHNPSVTGKVKVTASSVEVGSADDLLNKTPTELWTKDIPCRSPNHAFLFF